MVKTLNQQLFNTAKRYIPGGVNSPVRSFKAVGGYPIFIKEGKGSKIYSECGKEFIDYCMGFGALILGHSHPKVTEQVKKRVEKGSCLGTPTKLETELAKLITEAIPSIERVRLTNSGTEAVMTAIRLARAFTQRNKLIKFAGSYHGHADYLLDCPGVPEDFKKYTLIASYNDIEKVKELVGQHQKDIAAIIIEPIAANMGVVLPKAGFLQGLRKIADKYKIVLIFDEVITGFRLAFGGVQKLFKVSADLTCLGKIIGGGLPIGAVGGKKEIMELLVPDGDIYQAGTFSGNPLSVTAGLVTLKVLTQDNPYKKLAAQTRYLCEEVKERGEKYGFKIKVNFLGSMFSIFFADKEVMDYNIAASQETNLFKRFYHGLLKEGVYLSPSGLEANFISLVHTKRDLENTLEAADKTFKNLSSFAK